MNILTVPELDKTGHEPTDREPLHEYIRMLNYQLMTPQRGDTVPGAREKLEALRDEAQARLDAHASR